MFRARGRRVFIWCKRDVAAGKMPSSAVYAPCTPEMSRCFPSCKRFPVATGLHRLSMRRRYGKSAIIYREMSHFRWKWAGIFLPARRFRRKSFVIVRQHHNAAGKRQKCSCQRGTPSGNVHPPSRLCNILHRKCPCVC